jgi:hypothetical protein
MGVFQATPTGAISPIVVPGMPAPGGAAIDFAGRPTIGGAGDIGFDGHVRGRPCLARNPQSVAISCLDEAYAKTPRWRNRANRRGWARCAWRRHLQLNPIPNAHGDVLFAGDLAPAPRILRNIGLFISSGGSVSVVIRPGDALPGGGNFVTTGWFGGPGPQFSLNDRGEVAFAATLDTDDDGDGIPDTGVYVRSGGTLQLIARTGTVVPGIGTIAHIQAPQTIGNRLPFGGAVLNSRGDVLFEATLTNGLGVLLVAQR